MKIARFLNTKRWETKSQKQCATKAVSRRCSVRPCLSFLINPIQDVPFNAFGAVLRKICYTHPTTMKLGTIITHLKEIKKCINHVTHT